MSNDKDYLKSYDKDQQIQILQQELLELKKAYGELLSAMRMNDRKAIENSFIDFIKSHYSNSTNIFHSFINQSSEGISLADSDGRIIEWNLAMERMFGLDRKNVVGLNIWELEFQRMPLEKKTEEARNRIHGLMKSYLANLSLMKPLSYEGEMLDGRGKLIFVQITIFPIVLDKECLIGTLTRDVSERRQMIDYLEEKNINLETLNEEYHALNEERQNKNEDLKQINEKLIREVSQHFQTQKLLRQREELFRSFLEQSSEGIILINTEGRIVEWNTQMERIFDRSRDEMLSTFIWDFDYSVIPNERKKFSSKDRLQSSILEFFENLQSIEIESLVYFRNEERYIRINIFPVKIGTDLFIGRHISDITDRKESDKELENYRAHLEVIVENKSRELLNTQDQLKRLSDNIPGGFVFRGYTNKNGLDEIVYISTTAEFLLNSKIIELKQDGVPPISRIHEGDRDAFCEKIAYSKLTCELFDMELRFEKDKNIFIWLQIRIDYSLGDDLLLWWDGLLIDITQRKENEIAYLEREYLIKNIQEGIASATGEKLFNILLSKLAETLNADYSFVGEVNGTQVTTLKLFCKDGILDNFSYDLKGTPCENVVGKQLCIHTSKVADSFGEDNLLKQMGIEGYVGVPLFDSHGSPVGIMAALFKSSIKASELVIKVMQIFSHRAGVEIERVNYERTLREREEHFRTLFDFTPTLQLITTMDGVVLNANTSFLKSTGYSREDVIGKRTTDFGLWSESTRKSYMEAIDTFGFVNGISTYFIRNDKQRRDVLLSATKVSIDGKECILSNATDITELKKAEKYIKYSEKRLTDAQALAHVGHWEIDLMNRTISGSLETRRIYGLDETIDTFDLSTVQALVLFDDRKKMDDAITNLLSGESDYDIQFRLKRKSDGILTYVRSKAELEKDSDGLPIRIMGVIQDISQSVLAAEKLRENEERMKNILLNLSDIIWIIDERGQIVFETPSTNLLLGFTEGEMLGRSLNAMVHPNDLGIIVASLYDLRKGLTSHSHAELKMKKSDGTYILAECIAVLMPESLVSGNIIVTIRDITDRKLVEKKMLDGIIEAEERERQRMAGDLHDEIGPVLSSLKMYISSFAPNIPEEKQKYIIDQSMNLIKEAITSVREISNALSPHVLNNYGLVAALKNTMDGFSDYMKVDFKCNLEKTRLSLTIESVYYRIIKELINNTLKHSGANSIKIELLLEKDVLRLYYLDNGKGFDVDEIIKEKGRGIGLFNILSRVKTINGIYKFLGGKGEGFGFELATKID